MKLKLQTTTSIDKRIVIEHALNCDFHEAVKRDMARALTDEITKKVEFTEENDPGSWMLGVSASVYVLSSEEFNTIANIVREELEQRDEKIKEFGELNTNQELYIRSLHRDKEGLQNLLISSAMLAPPPIYIVSPPDPADKRRIAELEAALQAAEMACNGAVNDMWKVRHSKKETRKDRMDNRCGG